MDEYSPLDLALVRSLAVGAHCSDLFHHLSPGHGVLDEDAEEKRLHLSLDQRVVSLVAHGGNVGENVRRHLRIVLESVCDEDVPRAYINFASPRLLPAPVRPGSLMIGGDGIRFADVRWGPDATPVLIPYRDLGDPPFFYGE